MTAPVRQAPSVLTVRDLGPAPEREVARDLVKRGLLVLPVAVGLGALGWGAAGAASVAFAAGLVFVNFLLAAALLAWAARISLGLLMGVSLFGFVLRLALIADIARAWATYAADGSLLAIAERTAANAERSVGLTEARLRGGIVPKTDLLQARQILETAKSDLAEQRTAVAQDLNLLQLLVGATVDHALLQHTQQEGLDFERQLADFVKA